MGRIYYLIQEDELADMYLQVRRGLGVEKENVFVGTENS